MGIILFLCIYINEMVCWIKYYWGKLEFNSDVHDYNTRHKIDLHPLICRTNLTKNNGLYMGITLYNKLQEQLKKLEPKYRFKNNVKKYLLQNVFYSVNEYLSM
jgi:hypothetical protein